MKRATSGATALATARQEQVTAAVTDQDYRARHHPRGGANDLDTLLPLGWRRVGRGEKRRDNRLHTAPLELVRNESPCARPDERTVYEDKDHE
jgi:hypothetical protein